ncbi:MAG: hypothetical protein MUE53_09790, partial [Chitinophagales bacterium]|nr:hypothetical protein [Chitinophagales bacterium]
LFSLFCILVVYLFYQWSKTKSQKQILWAGFSILSLGLSVASGFWALVHLAHDSNGFYPYLIAAGVMFILSILTYLFQPK